MRQMLLIFGTWLRYCQWNRAAFLVRICIATLFLVIKNRPARFYFIQTIDITNVN